MKRGNFNIALCALLALAALFSTLATAAVFARGSSSSVHTSGSVSVSAQKASSQTVMGQSINVLKLPKEGSSPATSHRTIPFPGGPNYAQAQKHAAHNQNAPKGVAATVDSTTQSGIFGFQGMADSAAIWPYFGGFQPPDMALAASPQFVFQGVNTSFALWTTGGKLVEGPVNSQVFFGIPNPSPAGCDPAGPFTADPRAFYDPNTGLMWAAMLQAENGFGLSPTCNFLSRYWIANFNPSSGTGCAYGFDMALGTTNVADFTQFGFSSSTIAFTVNMWNQDDTVFQYAEAQFANKHTMEQCQPVTTTAFIKLAASAGSRTVLLDTVQPVETQTTPTNDPGVQYLVNSFDLNGDLSGNNCFSPACSGFVVWAFDPDNGSLAGTTMPTPTYAMVPPADEPGCLLCIETFTTGISGIPIYSVGGGQPLISFALETAVNNGGAPAPNVVPGILWGQIQVSHGPGFVLANLYQSGYLFFSSDRAATFGAMMQDKNGNLFMVFDTMSANLNPSFMIASRSKSDPLGTIGHARFIVKGPSATFNNRWGDFEAATYSGFASNQVWVASQYSVSGDWNTFIERVS